MAVVIETTLGDLTVDLFIEQRPRTCLNFLKLCKMKYYNFNLFHTIQNGFIAQTGDPTGEGSGGSSIWGVLEGADKRYFSGEKLPKIRHSDAGLLSMVAVDDSMIGSQFFFTLGENLNSLDSQHCVIGEVVEGHEVLRKLNETICDESYRPYQDVRITHTVVLDDPFDDPREFRAPSRSPSPSAEKLVGGRLAPDEEIDETKGKTAEEIAEMIQEKEAKARATILEIVGDLPDADMAPPENVLFVCKLNPVTTDEDLEIIFSRFGKIMNCEVIRDKKTGDSLQYAFIEFVDQKSCENAYFKMDNVLIDDRRIHVDFSQSVSKIKWQGKGRGVIHFDDVKRHPDRRRDLNKSNSNRKEIELQKHIPQLDLKKSSNRQRSSRSRSRDRRVDRSKQERSRSDYDDKSKNNRSKDRYENYVRNEHSHSYRDKDRNNYQNPSSHRSRYPDNKYDKERLSERNRDGNIKKSRETEDKRAHKTEDIRKHKTEKRRSRSPNIKKEYKDNGHKSTHSSYRDDRKPSKISNGEKSRCDTPPTVLIKKSEKRKLEDNSHKTDISHLKKIKKEKATKKKSSTSRRKKKPSTSSDSSSSDSSQSSTSSSSESSSSESDKKEKKIFKKKQKKKKKKQQTSSSSSDSSSESTSSSSDSSSSISSESDSEPARKKSKKKNVRNSKKVGSKKRKS